MPPVQGASAVCPQGGSCASHHLPGGLLVHLGRGRGPSPQLGLYVVGTHLHLNSRLPYLRGKLPEPLGKGKSTGLVPLRGGLGGLALTSPRGKRQENDVKRLQRLLWAQLCLHQWPSVHCGRRAAAGLAWGRRRVPGRLKGVDGLLGLVHPRGPAPAGAHLQEAMPAAVCVGPATGQAGPGGRWCLSTGSALTELCHRDPPAGAPLPAQLAGPRRPSPAAWAPCGGTSPTSQGPGSGQRDE